MKFGISIPNFGAFAYLDLLRDLARDAEHRGWHGSDAGRGASEAQAGPIDVH